MIDDLTMKVISVEDIPANVATKLVTLFNMMVTQTPQIFPVSMNCKYTRHDIKVQTGIAKLSKI